MAKTKTPTKKSAAKKAATRVWTLSDEGRARIVAAQKKRWKAFHAEQKAKAAKKKNK